MNKVGKEYPIKSHFSEKPDTAFAVALFQRMREEWSVWGVNQNETNAFRENCWKVVPHLIPHLGEQTMKDLVGNGVKFEPVNEMKKISLRKWWFR